MSSSNEVLVAIREANPTRSHVCVNRRLLKILEELGEASEAYLSRTSKSNYKHKTWDDFRVECVDILIVMLDVAMTPLPWSNWPPEALLHLQYEEGRLSPVKTLEGIEDLLFDVGIAVTAANKAMAKTDTGGIGFYGAISRGVKAATQLCYAVIPGENKADIEKSVYNTVKAKIQKWKGGTTAPVKEEVVDAKTFMEHIEERELGNL